MPGSKLLIKNDSKIIKIFIFSGGIKKITNENWQMGCQIRQTHCITFDGPRPIKKYAVSILLQYVVIMSIVLIG